MAKSYLEPEFEPAFSAWSAKPGPDTTDQLLTTVKPVIDRAIHSYVGQDEPLIRSTAKRIVVNALPSYDRSAAGLGTFLHSRLQSLQRAARKQQQILSIPERVQMESGHLKRVEDNLTEKLGREPSTAELASASGLSAKRIAKVRAFRYPVSEGSMITLDDEGQEQGPAVVDTGKERAEAWRQIVYMDADPVDQKIMEWSFGMHGAPQIEVFEMAKRLGVTPAAISQRRNRLQRMLDQEAELSPYA
jgi:DNA-directed RNA polymerase specialized sigma subunit